ncbi:SBBP repeat-containing protein [uncultured Bacteroides sp.]|uniref:SBBP repeat-containing protein n=1 Tax=uncultured Bacteroides sp. TaxID=162156 RepID=UPI002AAB2C50|nr:SBBP repeat-containing protein [uncultured Bacteroides sp.]
MKKIILIVGLCIAIASQAYADVLPLVGLNLSGTGVTKDLQFTSSGHALIFNNKGVMVASTSHALKVSFLHANVVTPKAENTEVGSFATNDPTSQKSVSLGKVTYTNIWDNVSLEYEASGNGIYETTYHLNPNKTGNINVGNIRLGYNRPLTLDKKGNLVISYQNGMMNESAPVAWQVIHGERHFVSIVYKLYDKQEVGFTLGKYTKGIPVVIDPTLSWNTFLGGTGTDTSTGVTVDASGNVYVCGSSTASWGSPLRAYSGGSDAFVAKLSSTGALIWNTFLGGISNDDSSGIAVDASGNVYVCGVGWNSWGVPVQAPVTTNVNVFVAKLSSTGTLIWNTFQGLSGSNFSVAGIAVDNNNAYVCGNVNASFGVPIRSYVSKADCFVIKLNENGVQTWNTFLGGGASDTSTGISVDGSGNVYVCGHTIYSLASSSWGSPVRAYSGNSQDAFVAKLSSAGTLVWNTFLGGNGQDYSTGIAIDTNDNVYVSGYSNAIWGTSVQAYAGGGEDAFVAKLSSSGSLIWNTFMGGSGIDYTKGIAVDENGSVFVCGYSDSTWGLPIRAYTSGNDAFVAQFSTDGDLLWNTFQGGSGNDYAYSIAAKDYVYICGKSNATWGSPTRAYTSGDDAFVNMFQYFPIVKTLATSDIGISTATANGTISFFGDPDATAYGICWNTTGMPTTSDSKVDKGAPSAKGAFTCSITGLAPGKTYYARAYATNIYGTVYGKEVTFTTKCIVTFNTPDNGILMVENGNTVLTTGDLVDVGSELSLILTPNPGFYISAYTVNGAASTSQSFTVAGNTIINSGYASTVTVHELSGYTINLYNNIIWNNNAEATNKNLSDNNTNHIALDPLFTSSTNYYLQKMSAACNSGDNSKISLTKDIAGCTRRVSALVNKGAYEQAVRFILPGEWTSASNWYQNNISVAGDYTTIEANANIGAGVNAEALNLEIFPNNASVTIQPTATLTVGGLINNAGSSGLIINSTSAGTGSLIHTSDNVPATVKRYIDGAAASWHFLSSPVIGQNITGAWKPAGTYGDGTGYDLYVWNEPTSCWIYNLNTTVTPTWPSVHPQSSFVSGRGYLYAVQETNPTKTFIGNLGNGTIVNEITASALGKYNGFNLLGNPYPSSIDWKTEAGFTRDILYNNGGGYDIWVWSSTANNYGVYNSAYSSDDGTNNVTRYIAPMQGFFVRAASAGMFSINNASRTNFGASIWTKGFKITEPKLSLSVTSAAGLGSDEVLYTFDKVFDEGGAIKLFSPVKTAPSLYLTANDGNYSTCHLADSIGSRELPIQFKAGNAGSYTLKCSNTERGINNIILKDCLTGTVTDITSSREYSFTATTDNNVSRFVLYLNSKTTDILTDICAKVYMSSGNLVIDLLGLEGNYNTLISDTSGRIVSQMNLTGGEKYSQIISKRGVYIVTLSSPTIKKEYKVVRL